MKPFIENFSAFLVLLITVIIQYRLPRRILGRKYTGIPTFLIILGVNIFASWLNLSLEIVTDVGGNTLYYAIFNFILYLLLFNGGVIKKVFLTVLIAYGLPIPFYILLPIVSCFFLQGTEEFSIALIIVGYINIVVSAVGMEYVGKKFQNLRRELPVDYTIYLSGVIIFVYVAIYSSYERLLRVNQGLMPLPSALITTVAALAGSAIVWIAIFAVDRQVNISLKEQFHTIQSENFKRNEREWRRFSGFRHDIKNHLICLSKLLENGKTTQAISYMQNLTDTVKQFDSPIQTGNDYADALLSVKYAEAVDAKIAVSLDMMIPPTGFIEPMDLCCILSNAFDNAIAACSHLDPEERWITARGFIKQGQFVIAIKNSKPSYVTVIDGEVSPKEITSDHGLGLDTVKAVVEKYGGVLTLSAQDAFSFSVLLPKCHL